MWEPPCQLFGLRWVHRFAPLKIFYRSIPKDGDLLSMLLGHSKYQVHFRPYTFPTSEPRHTVWLGISSVLAATCHGPDLDGGSRAFSQSGSHMRKFTVLDSCVQVNIQSERNTLKLNNIVLIRPITSFSFIMQY